jgi:hypothetical protein
VVVVAQDRVMARRTLIWHLGPAQPARPLVAANLEVYAEALATEGVQVVASAEEARLATHELLRTHRQAGLARADVEGRWARICDRVWQHRGVSLVSTPDLCVADKDQLKHALNPLIGVEVHLVLTLDTFSQQLYGGWLAELRSGRATGWDKYVARVLAATREHRQAERFWTGHDLPAVLNRWGWTFHAERLHVVAERDVEQHWRQLLDVAGLAPTPLDPVVPPYADPAGVAVLRKVNRQLEDPVHPGALGFLTDANRELSALPVADTVSLRPLVESWTETLVAAGHDLRGDLSLLLDSGEGIALPGPHDQLEVAVEALAEVLAQNTRLRAAVDELEGGRERLERKRRKLKRRLARLGGKTSATN